MAANPTSQSTSLALRPSGAVALALQSAGTALSMNLLEMVANGKANLVSPAVMLDKVPTLYRLAVRVVTIDPKVETYKAPGKPGEVCLGATALQKISRNAQVDWESIRQIDDWRDPHRVKYEAIGWVMNLDGTRTRMPPGIVVIDLRGEPTWPVDKLGSDTREFLRHAEAAAQRKPMTFDIPPGTKSSACRDCNRNIFWVPNPYKKDKTRPVDADGSDHWKTCPAKEQKPEEESGWPRVYQARQFIDRLAATKAMNAAIRKLGVPTSMPEERAAQPWVVMALVFDPPTDDPEIRRMLVAHALGAQNALYGPQVSAGPAPAREAQGEVIDVSAMREAPDEPAPPVQPAASPGPELPPEEPAPPSAVPCGLPITEAVLNTIPVNDEKRYENVSIVMKWQVHAEKRVGQERAAAIFAKLGTGFDPLKASNEEFIGLVGAIKAEIGAGK